MIEASAYCVLLLLVAIFWMAVDAKIDRLRAHLEELDEARFNRIESGVVYLVSLLDTEGDDPDGDGEEHPIPEEEKILTFRRPAA